ncbi:MAG TPA: DUF3108 domain-containing protein [Anaeromyxobacteraceae bacterium]|nr:DUF3108 domain-containing protein [Anaeromyxobacteraceae bacterium]
MTAAALALALGLAAAPPGCDAPPLRKGALPFRPGEALAYDVDVMGVVQAGTLSLAVVPLRARFRNSSVFAQMRRARGYALSWADVATLRPQRYRDDSEEDGVRKTTDTRLDVPGPVTMAWSFGDRKGTSTLERRGELLDLLSMIYRLRASRLAAGDRLCFDLVANRRFWRFSGSVAPGTERVESAAGIFDTVRVDATVTRADGQGPSRPVHLWFGTDARHLPVAAVSEIDLGPVRAMLKRSAGAPAAEPAD